MVSCQTQQPRIEQDQKKIVGCFEGRRVGEKSFEKPEREERHPESYPVQDEL
jgi:hypothetical protein